MTSQERVATVLSGGVPDRVPIYDSYWGATIERWRREGLPHDVSPADYFEHDIVRIGGDYSMQFPVRLLEETDTYRVYVDENGATRKDFKNAGGWTPHWLDFTIKSKDDWRKHRYRCAFNEGRISTGVERAYHRARAQGKSVIYSGHACFHPTWAKIGMETELMWMVEAPDLIHEMFAAQTQLMIDIYEGMKRRGMTFDAAWFNDDLGYNKTSLISPQMYRELVFPYHKQLCDYFANEGLKSLLHSDGNLLGLIPHFLDAGFVGLHPLEAKAGLDVRDLKPQYGKRLILFGNVDVRAMAAGGATLEEEIISKITAAKEGGGYLYHSDHSVPDDVSFANYCRVIELVKQHGTYV